MLIDLFYDQCVDIEFAEPGDSRIAEVNETNCFNSTDLGFAEIYTITTKAVGESANSTSGAAAGISTLWMWTGYLPVIAGGLWLLL